MEKLIKKIHSICSKKPFKLEETDLKSLENILNEVENSQKIYWDEFIRIIEKSRSQKKSNIWELNKKILDVSDKFKKYFFSKNFQIIADTIERSLNSDSYINRNFLEASYKFFIHLKNNFDNLNPKIIPIFNVLDRHFKSQNQKNQETFQIINSLDLKNFQEAFDKIEKDFLNENSKFNELSSLFKNYLSFIIPIIDKNEKKSEEIESINNNLTLDNVISSGLASIKYKIEIDLSLDKIEIDPSCPLEKIEKLFKIFGIIKEVESKLIKWIRKLINIKNRIEDHDQRFENLFINIQTDLRKIKEMEKTIDKLKDFRPINNDNEGELISIFDSEFEDKLEGNKEISLEKKDLKLSIDDEKKEDGQDIVSKLLKTSPFVDYGTDLEYWTNGQIPVANKPIENDTWVGTKTKDDEISNQRIGNIIKKRYRRIITKEARVFKSPKSQLEKEICAFHGPKRNLKRGIPKKIKALR